MLPLVIIEGVAVVLLGVLVVGLLRSHAEILRRLHELGAGIFDDEPVDAGRPSGGDRKAGVTSPVALVDRPEIRTRDGVSAPRTTQTPAHDLAGISPVGAAMAVGVVGTGHSTLLAFLSSGCGTCGGFWQAFNGGAARSLPGTDTRLVVVTKGPEAETPAAVASLAPPQHTTVMSTEAFGAYGVPVSPYFILVDGPSGEIVGEGAAATWDQIANLLGQAAADAGFAASAPAFRVRGAHNDGPTREALADAELAAAGIGPDHPSLYPETLSGSDS